MPTFTRCTFKKKTSLVYVVVLLNMILTFNSTQQTHDGRVFVTNNDSAVIDYDFYNLTFLNENNIPNWTTPDLGGSGGSNLSILDSEGSGSDDGWKLNWRETVDSWVTQSLTNNDSYVLDYFPSSVVTETSRNISYEFVNSTNPSSSDNHDDVDGTSGLASPALAVILALFCVFTVFGNVLVMLAVARERYLHTVTNYFIVSLATADCLVGAFVMPFSVVHEVMDKIWIFGRDWCDVWHSVDVLGSTASILNLCVISLDRYWAITDPITYPSKMTIKRSCLLIGLVWVCASLISFPAIAWWRAVSLDIGEANRCSFTEDLGYLVFSSIISFYGPLTVMVFTYFKIYRAATEQTRSLRLGTKQVLAMNGEESMELTLRIHRGGTAANSANTNGNSGGMRKGYHHVYHPPLNPHPPSCPAGSHGHNSSDMMAESIPLNMDTISKNNSLRVVPKNVKHFSFSRKLARMAKEQKAAKTLGIVMGVFVLCWMPFFLCNVLLGICSDYCFDNNAELVFSVVTWLGWINSGMNPVIYACWSRDFRRAFIKILCICCPRLVRPRYHNRLHGRVCQSLSTPMSSTCSTECVRL